MPKSFLFAHGQRWLSETEPELGLGIVTELDHRTVTIAFRSCDQVRRYARAQAPLSRIAFAAGDTITTCHGDALIVLEVSSHKDTLVYDAHLKDDPSQRIKLPEALLSDTLILNKPLERLFAGQTDAAQWFYLRKHTIERLAEIERSRVLGLCSGRTDLIPHQLYIAAEVAARHAPRVMLADEVGLGKTIEAGLILQQQLVNGLASVLTSVDLFHRQPAWYEFALKGEWDLCIVDEAHHLRDEPAAVSANPRRKPVTDYSLVKKIADSARGILLLTATPEQMGQENHFALLQLLDANRFTDFASYQQEHSRYHNLAGTINALVSREALGAAQITQLQQVLARHHSPEGIAQLLTPLLPGTRATAAEKDSAREQLIRLLLDQHGTGRILFRNTRKALTGFPEREVQVYPLDLPEAYDELRKQRPLSLDTHLKPEMAYISASALLDEEEQAASLPWTSVDTRVKWLVEFLQSKRGEKVLLICAQDVTAISLEKYLRVNAGIRSSVFHRHMDLIDRDRAAAYFAGTESSAQILVCSEIGSEGRNFQFCHHLVLFDLPLNPDLLEQRIGRLDRIGQKHTIQIHVPIFDGSAQEALFQWYQQALNAFAQVAPAAYRVYREHQEALHAHLLACAANTPDYQQFLATAHASNVALNQALEQGRDRLLEINSFNRERAEQLVQQIRDFEEVCTPEDYMKEAFDAFGIHYEHNSDNSYSIQPTEEMIVPAFPGLPDEGIDAAFDRQLSLHREDLHFLTWQHPMVRGAIDMVLDSPQGGAAVSVLSARDAAPTGLDEQDLVVEALYRVVAPAPRHLQIARYLPATSFAFTLVPEDAEERSKPVSLDPVRSKLRFIDKHDAAALVSEHQARIAQLLQQGEQLAQAAMSRCVAEASATMLQSQTAEIKRLVALKQVNPNVRDAELAYLKEQTLQLHQCMKQASVELLAVHVVFKA